MFDFHQSQLESAITELENGLDKARVEACLTLGWLLTVAGRGFAAATTYTWAISALIPHHTSGAEIAILEDLQQSVTEENPRLARDLEEAIRMLQIGRAVAQDQVSAGCRSPVLAGHRLSREEYDRNPTAILVGGSSPELDGSLRETYGPVLRDALRSFQGIVISGGTTTGIPGLVGDIARAHATRKYRLVGYVPSVLPPTGSESETYHNYRTQGETFSQREPIQYWTDIISSGADPGNVRLLGINGGRISSFEYSLGLAVGARVGIVSGSGRAADEFLTAEPWWRPDRLTALHPEATLLREFLAPTQDSRASQAGRVLNRECC